MWALAGASCVRRCRVTCFCACCWCWLLFVCVIAVMVRLVCLIGLAVFGFACVCASVGLFLYMLFVLYTDWLACLYCLFLCLFSELNGVVDVLYVVCVIVAWFVCFAAGVLYVCCVFG